MGTIDFEKDTHGIALNIENLMSKYVNSEKLCGRGGVLNADFIERNPYFAIMCSLFYVAGNDPDRCDDYINDFMEVFSFDHYSKMAIADILNANGATQTYEGTEYVGCKDGKEVISDMESFIRDRFDK